MNGSFGGGTGTGLDPYLIEDIFDLDEVRRKPANTCYKLVADIDMNVYPWNVNEGWMPIAINYSGVFDGNFYTIRNMYTERNQDNIALFATTNNATFRHIYLEDFRLNVDNYNTNRYVYMGGLVGSFTGGLIEGIVVSRIKIFGNYFLGGLIGYQTSGTIRNCLVDDVEINNSTSSNYSTGGFVGNQSGGIIENSFVNNFRIASGSPGNSSTYVGGFSGSRSGTIRNCFWDASIITWSGSGNSATSLNSTQIVQSSQYVGVGATSNIDDALNYKNFKSWIIDVSNTQRPRLFMEKGINKSVLTYQSDYTNDINFGAVVEGQISSYRKVTVKVAYDVPISAIDITWDRKDGVSELTEIQFSEDQQFNTPTSELHFTGLNLVRGDEVTFYMRINTQVGMSGDGQFNLYVDVSS
jgi:hypothetical protein